MITYLSEVFMTLLVLVGILMLLVLIYAIISAPFKEMEKKKNRQEIAKILENIFNECLEELKQEQETKEEDK